MGEDFIGAKWRPIEAAGTGKDSWCRCWQGLSFMQYGLSWIIWRPLSSQTEYILGLLRQSSALLVQILMERCLNPFNLPMKRSPVSLKLSMYLNFRLRRLWREDKYLKACQPVKQFSRLSMCYLISAPRSVAVGKDFAQLWWECLNPMISGWFPRSCPHHPSQSIKLTTRCCMSKKWLT